MLMCYFCIRLTKYVLVWCIAQYPSAISCALAQLPTHCTKLLDVLRVLREPSATVSSTAHMLLQLSYAAQHTAILPHQHPVPFDRLQAMWSNGDGKLQQYAVGCGGLNRILQDLHDQMRQTSPGPVSRMTGHLTSLLAQLDCLALISACCPEALVYASERSGFNVLQLCARICSWLQNWTGSSEERVVCEACQAAALKVLLHLVVTADQLEGVRQDVRDKLKAQCVVDPVPGALKQLAEGAHLGMALDGERILQALGMHYLIRCMPAYAVSTAVSMGAPTD
jgi:hypothetical protein